MKISVVIATYNGERFLEQQLNSILEQTVLPDELIVSDDNSSDSTREIVEQFAKKTSFPVSLLLNDKNKRGYTQNFQNALGSVTGDLIFLSDQDDVWFPQKIETVKNHAQHSEKQMFVHNAEYTDEKLNKLGITTFGKFALTQKRNEEFVSGSVMAIKQELLHNAMPIPDNFVGHDNWIAGFAQALQLVEVIEEPLMYYRRHAGATMIRTSGVKNVLKKLTKKYRIMDVFFNNNQLLIEKLENTQLLSISDREHVSEFVRKLNLVNLPYKIRNELLQRNLIERLKLMQSQAKILYAGKYGAFILICDVFGIKLKSNK